MWIFESVKFDLIITTEKIPCTIGSDKGQPITLLFSVS